MGSNGLIQIPKILVENKDIHPSTTYLYLMMKMKAQHQKDNTFILNMYSDNFLEYIDWTQKTFKQHLEILNGLGIVLDYELPKFKAMKIHIEKVSKKTGWVQIDTATVNKMLTTAVKVDYGNNVKKNNVAQAIRLYYYYEHRYNTEMRYSFPTFEQIAKDCKISKATISILNEYLKKEKLIHIKHGKEWYIDAKTGRPKKENNTYVPLWNGRCW